MTTKKTEQDLREFLFKYYKCKQWFLDMSLFKKHLEYFLDCSLRSYEVYNSDLNKISAEFSLMTVANIELNVSCCFEVHEDRYVFRSFEIERKVKNQKETESEVKNSLCY